MNKKIFSKRLTIALAVICVSATCGSVGYLIKYVEGCKMEEASYEKMRMDVIMPPSPSSEPTIEESTAGEKEEKIIIEIPDDNNLLRRVDFESLKAEVNADIYAWVYIPNTAIDYPILQHPTDNAHYLFYNLDGTKGYPGCIYTEKENAKDFSDFNTLVYGHNMRNGTMFHDLHKYEDESFLSGHPYVYIYIPDRTLRYQIFSAYQYDDRHLLYSFDYISEAGREDYLTEISNINSAMEVLDTEPEVTSESHILTLSTCMGSHSEDRYLVQAVLVNDIPLTEIDKYLGR